MSGFSFRRAAIEALDLPWRPLDRTLARWVLAHGGDEALATVAAWTSYAESLGDTMTMLADDASAERVMPPLSIDQIASLRRSSLVGDGSVRAPFVIDRDGRFYLWRNFAHERAVAAALNTRLIGPTAAATLAASALKSAVNALFGGQHDPNAQAQREAVASVADRRLFVLTGGPGTGKTTTVLRMLLLLQRVAHAPPARIAIAAPTGKAAQRLLQALRAGKESLQATLPVEWQPLLDAVPDREAVTIHRLLGFDPRTNQFRRGREDPIAADIVVIDEASMIDLAMLRALLDAVPEQACLILVGDADQLTSVAAGSVLQDLVQVLERDYPAHVARLLHSFRAAPKLLAINAATRAGDADALAAAIDDAAEAACLRRWQTDAALRVLVTRWADRLAVLGIRTVVTADQGPAPALEALRALSRRQLLCALREQPSGALALGTMIERRLRMLWQIPLEQTWFSGRAVMVTRNDYATGLFNGDVGLALDDGRGGVRVWFPWLDEEGRPTARSFAPGLLPAHESAFAISIHKSQGSEYDAIAVVLPADGAHRILSRQLLYTALSRARESIELWGSDPAIHAALARVTLRHGGLAARLRES